ncbi:AT-rich interactive domain-containing protein 2 [Orchesella cincta]|uniref:AT-rich interactive domain-containing protein 2 n=1 Tax=Orchesella cincta TaxID=48709 RepID=A0A1D2MDD9_ORCCI|nr:AT-rich interactive domain-containing protein 2 [Orchesella cincta]
MGIQQKDPEYLGAKYAFIRDLIQFHEARGTGLQCDPKINGKEVDLYLLYQIVTSHGGWEKINLRNEWDKLLEHFHMPRSTNGGVAIKQIYLKYLELYEKIHYLGEEVDSKADDEDEYEDFRGRRRYPGKFSSSHSHHHHHHSHSHHHHHHTSSSSHHPPKEITEHNRSQLGLSSRLLETSDYEGLLLSLQSPLPNEQDMAISVCTLLSNETKHVLRFSKSPAILNMLLAHAGIYQDCEFWDEVLQHPDARQLLCECFVRRVHTSLGLTDDEGAIISQIQEIEDGDLPDEEKFALGTALRLKLRRFRESRSDANEETTERKSDKVAEDETGVKVKEIEGDEDEKMSITNGEETPVVVEPEDEDMDKDKTEIVNPESSEGAVAVVEEIVEEVVECKKEPLAVLCPSELAPELVENECMELDDSQLEVKCEQGTLCCSHCPCQRAESGDSSFASGDYSVEFSIERPSSKRGRVMMDEAADGPANSLPFTLARTHNAGDKVGQRICQIAHILRNLSFEQDNASIMAKNATLMRFLLVAANCTFGSLPQTSFDIIGNISSYIKLEEPLRDPLSSMLLTLVTSGVFSTDRFKILRSLEALRELTKVHGNENIIARYIENRVYRRMCDLLTLSDIMLLIYTLECILSMTGLGEAVCDEIVRVQGSVATLVSLVTVEAQSYGPKGCILMRVVETVTGASTVTTHQQQSTSAAIGTPSTPQQQPIAITQAAVGPLQSQHLLQQQLQQPPIASPIMAAPTPVARATNSSMSHPPPATSPGLKFVTGTTTVVPPVQGQHAVQQKQATTGVPYNGSPSLATSISMNSSQVFSHPPPPL